MGEMIDLNHLFLFLGLSHSYSSFTDPHADALKVLTFTIRINMWCSIKVGESPIYQKAER
jgi:hypothetical protein